MNDDNWMITEPGLSDLDIDLDICYSYLGVEFAFHFQALIVNCSFVIFVTYNSIEVIVPIKFLLKNEL